MSEIKVDLALLNKLVKELNDEFAKAADVKKLDALNKHDYVAASAKCLGLANAIAIESTALVHDYFKEIRTNSAESGPLDSPLVGDGEPFTFNDLFKKKN